MADLDGRLQDVTHPSTHVRHGALLGLARLRLRASSHASTRCSNHDNLFP